MSFILDALKKSEERRRLEEGSRPPRQRIFDLSWSGTHRWPIWIVLTVLLVALAFGWWLRGISLHPDTVAQPSVPPAAVTSGQVPPSVASPSAGSPGNPVQPSPAREVVTAPFAPVPAVPVGEAGSPAAGNSRPVAGKPVVTESPAKVSSTAPAEQAARQRQAPGQVPAGLRERMSGLKLSVHFYAEDPAQRLVRIDNRFLREGQALADGLVLEEITPRGAIFSSAGKRFEVPRLGEHK